MKSDKNVRFAALPCRALRDMQLEGRHLRLLGIIAAHDQLDKNGVGCFALQRRLAMLAGCGEARLSQTLTDLRDWGYIRSEKHPKPKKRRLRVHRVIYDDDQDKAWDQDTFPLGKVSPDTFPLGKVSPDTFPLGKVELSPQGKSKAIFGNRNQLEEKEISPNFEPRNICSEHIKKINGAEKGTDCAEAHSRERTVVENPEQYLGHCEALLSSPDAASLKFERNLIAELADDPCQPEQVTERAAKLLSRIR